jgi:hypothetical protein
MSMRNEPKGAVMRMAKTAMVNIVLPLEIPKAKGIEAMEA